MDLSPSSFSRREILRATAGLGLSCWLPRAFGADPPPKKLPKVAAIFTEFRFRSHAYNILENFFAPYLFRGKLVEPGVQVASFYADQFPEDDMARPVSEKLGVPLYQSIDEALCLGGKNLAVDAVLLIGEHGDYPTNELGQKQYPRKVFFDRTIAVMKRSERFVPIFNDKHLSYRWDWAKEMHETAVKHKIPFLAGSSVPLGERRPPLSIPAGSNFAQAVVVHGGPLEIYDFHGLELLQSILELRKQNGVGGRERGISSVEFLEGDALKSRLKKEPTWRELLDTAMAAENKADLAKLRQPRPKRLDALSPTPPKPDDPTALNSGLFVTYADGLHAAIFSVGSDSNRWNFAGRLQGQSKPLATTTFNGPWGNRCMFKALSHAIQHTFKTGKTPYPIERTLLTTGALEAAMRSRAQGGKLLETPHLQIEYDAMDCSAFCEDGSSWKVLTKDRPQPQDFAPGDTASH